MQFKSWGLASFKANVLIKIEAWQCSTNSSSSRRHAVQEERRRIEKDEDCNEMLLYKWALVSPHPHFNHTPLVPHPHIILACVHDLVITPPRVTTHLRNYLDYLCPDFTYLHAFETFHYSSFIIHIHEFENFFPPSIQKHVCKSTLKNACSIDDSPAF